MLPDWMDRNVTEMLATVVPGCAIGTLWRAIVTPRENIGEMAKSAAVSITVGAVIGGGAVQYFNLEGMLASSVIATVAYLGEHTLELFDKRGQKLRQGKIDISVKGDDSA